VIHWLVEFEIDGRPYRWAVEAVTVENDDGDVFEYRQGLTVDEPMFEGQDEAGIEIADATVDWPAFAPGLECTRATVRRWTEGTVLEAAVVFVDGEIRGVEHGTRFDPVSFTIERRSGGEMLGTQVPDVLATVQFTTWPTTGTAIGDQGVSYPVIFGYPGYTGASTPIPVVPVPLAQWDADEDITYAIVSEDAAAPITSVRLRNDTMNEYSNPTVTIVEDQLGRPVRAMNFTLATIAWPASSDEQAELTVGFSPAGGGGVARSAYDCFEYVLRRWGQASADWQRLREIRDALSIYQVDTWIDTPIDDPWAWIEGILPDLPVVVRTSARGRYFVERRYAVDGTRHVGSLEAGAGAERTSAVGVEKSGPFNEYTGVYRPGIDDAYIGRVIMTGSPNLHSAPFIKEGPVGSSTFQIIAVHRSGLCAASLAKFGLRQSELVEIDWTWDESTVAAVLGWRAQRDAIPARIVEYTVENGDELREGDEVNLTDDELGLDAVGAIVDSPPLVDRTRWASVVFRIPSG
jgi:hypothetical protein